MTVRIPLRNGRFSLVDECDAHLAAWSWFVHKGSKDKQGYVAHEFNFQKERRGKWFLQRAFIHHAILGRPLQRGMVIDHINGDCFDNRRSNLRIVTQRENNSNRSPRREGRTSSRYVGVHLHDKRWRAKIGVNGRDIHLGDFDDEELARDAYQQALRVYGGSSVMTAYTSRNMGGEEKQ